MLVNQDESFYGEYAAAAAAIKGVDPSGLADALSQAFNSVYRLVALDIDGTLTSETSAEVNTELAVFLGSLLSRDVSVVLVTGRGRTATRGAAETILKKSGVERRFFGRLSALASNGMYLLETEPDSELLNRVSALTPGFDLSRATTSVAAVLQAESIEHEIVPHAVSSEADTGALRVNLVDPLSAAAAYDALAVADLGVSAQISTGRYAETITIDVTSTNKADAIVTLAERRGIEPAMVLRVGDRGDVGENDYTMLANPAGFSVGSCSADPSGCWPVLGVDLETLSGIDATASLLDRVLLFAPLSVAPEEPRQVLEDLLQVERTSQRRARKAGLDIAERLRKRALAFATTGGRYTPPLEGIQAEDLFDPWSGGVRLRDWELAEVPPAAAELFALPMHEVDLEEMPTSSWSMWTDTGVLLRGPKYYTGLVEEDTAFEVFANDHVAFLRRAQEALASLQPSFSVVSWKLLLAILDHARNLSLQTLLAAFKATETELASAAHRVAVDLAYDHASTLVHVEGDWPAAIDNAKASIEQTIGVATRCGDSCGQIPIYEYRECDWFLENVAAIEIALTDLTKAPGWPPDSQMLAVGLANGGAEFPALLQAVARRMGVSISGGLLRLSTYGENKPSITERVRRGDAEYVRRLRDDPARFMTFVDVAHPAAVVLCDDNLTTGISLQHARDVMLLRGDRVIGATVVRYPSANRAAHMSLPGHGFPDPTAIGTFVHGLVSPSPYTRLLVPNRDENGNPYRDQGGTFNKAKARIERLLGLVDPPAKPEAV